MAKVGRRKFISDLTKTTLAASVLGPVPFVYARKKIKLRVLGTHVTLQEEIRQRAMKDLGIELDFNPNGSTTVLQKAAANPSSFDIYEQWSDSINILWQARAIQAIEVDRLKYWNEINSLAKTGRLTSSAQIGSGDAPHKILYVQKDNRLGQEPSPRISFMPYVHNVDSFGYNTQFIKKGEAYKTESWAWLLDEQYRGKVGLINAPTIGIFDAALAAEASGLVRFKDIGDMSMEEIDKLFEVLTRFKKAGHFAGFWDSVPQSVEFMVNKRVYLQSMFSPGVSSANGLGLPVTYASPKEGYRAWHGVMCLSSKVQDPYVKDAAYEFMNWWLSGWAGSFIARQGYYISNPERSRPLLPADEWDYWYEGKPAQRDLRGTDGKVSVVKGSIRDGGSYVQRFSNVRVWNTVMKNYDYSLDRWYEFMNS